MVFFTPNWQTNRDLKLAERANALKVGTKVIESQANGYQADLDADLPFLSATAAQVAAAIAGQKPGWTAVRVLSAYIRAATRAQEKTNCLTEVLFVHAFERAKELDAHLARTGEVVGPLHGVPVSLKDQFDYEGVDSTIGFTHQVGKPAATHSTLVSILLAAGAVPFVKTNVPQTMLAFECSNPTFGRSLNPYSSLRTCGGSSGGEGALLGSDGSPLGFGSDIGGSLRIPAHYSGAYGIKPCYGRVPARGARGSNPGFEAVKGALGPMGRSVADLELGLKVVIDAESKQAKVEGSVPLPWREVELPEKLKFGYFVDDGFCKASPACARAVGESVAALEKAGHECVPITPPNAADAMEIFVALSSAGGYQTLLAGLEGDPQEPALFLTTLGPKLPWFVREGIALVLKHVVGDALVARLQSVSSYKTVTELQAWQDRRNKNIQQARDELWLKHKLDAVLCPVQAIPAIEHDATRILSPLCIGTVLWNVIDATAGVLPVTFVDRVKDALPADWTANVQGSRMALDKVYGAGGAYDADRMAGLPVGVQLVAGTWEEEKCVGMMRVLDEALGERGFGPGQYARRGQK